MSDLDAEEFEATREKLGLKGKCQTCLGCKLLDDLNFKGKNECDYYEEGNSVNWFIVIVALINLLVLGYMMYLFYIFLSMKVGG